MAIDLELSLLIPAILKGSGLAAKEVASAMEGLDMADPLGALLGEAGNKITRYLDAPGGLRRTAKQVHGFAGDNIAKAQRTVAVNRVRLVDGSVTFYASGSEGRLNYLVLRTTHRRIF